MISKQLFQIINDFKNIYFYALHIMIFNYNIINELMKYRECFLLVNLFEIAR